MNRVLVLVLLVLFSLPGVCQEDPAWRAAMGEALSLHRQGKTAAAVATAQKALELARAEDDPMAQATVSSGLGIIYLESEDYFRARDLFAAAAVVYESDPRLGPEHEFTAKLYKSRALCAHELGQEKEAEAFFRKALHAYELLDDQHFHPDTLDILQGLANTLAAQHRIGEARALFEEVQEKSEPDSLAVMKASQGLAQLCSAVGDYERAIDELRGVIAHYEKSGTVKDVERLSLALGDLGAVYQERGDYRAAEANFKRSLSLRRAVAPGRPSVGAAVNNLASLYSGIGDKQQALPLFREALEIHRTNLGEEHPLTATSMNNLALVLSELGQRDEAERLLKQSLEIQRKLSGADSVEVAGQLNNLGTLYLSAGQYAKALPVLGKAATILEASGERDYATVLGNLGSAFDGLGRYAEAESAFQKVLGLGNASAAYTAHNNLAYLYIDTKKPGLALEQARLAGDLHYQKLREIFSFTSERQRLSFMREMSPYGLYASLSSPDDLFRTALRFKGAVLDSMVEEQKLARASQDPELAALLSGALDNKAELMQLELLPQDDPARRLLPAARARQEEAEAELARRVSDLGQGRDLFGVTPDQVRAALPPGTVLVELLHHGFYLGKGKSEKRYSALVIAASGPVSWVPLGSADSIEAKIRDYRALIQGRRAATRAGRVVLAASSAGADPALLKELYQTLWAPLAKTLPEGTRAVILSPDGELNFVSFATLLGPDDRFLGETLALSYVSSGRDLVLERPSPAAGPSALIGAPDYGEPARPEDTARIALAPLPGTQEECAMLETVLRKRGESPVAWVGKEATEQKLRALESSHLMHIATHGLFLSQSFGPESPMSRSGLALTGAQTTLDAWADGKAPPQLEDGFLSAAEVGALDLKGTELVVLSACDTGLGASENGEGVLGLRRGFVQSGTANLLFTLWPIDDRETALFMADFYAALASGSPRTALSATQGEWLSRLRGKEGAVTAARLAGPFVLSTRGRLSTGSP